MTAYLKGFVIRDGKLVKKQPRKSVSRQIAERRSKRQTAVSRANAEFLRLTSGHGNGTKGSEKA